MQLKRIFSEPQPQLRILRGGKADACPDCQGEGGHMSGGYWDPETGFTGGEWEECGCQLMARFGGEPLEEEVTDQGAPLDWNPEEFNPW